MTSHSEDKNFSVAPDVESQRSAAGAGHLGLDDLNGLLQRLELLGAHLLPRLEGLALQGALGLEVRQVPRGGWRVV